MSFNLRIALLFVLAVLPQVVLAQNTETAETAQTKSKTISPELLWELGRLGESAVSPDGASVAFTVRRYVLADNEGKSSLMLRSIEDGSEKVLLESWSSIGSLQWVGEGDQAKLFFEGLQGEDDAEEGDEEDKDKDDQEDDEDEETPQAWSITASGGAPTQVSDLEDGIANLKVSPTGKHIAYTADIKLDKTVNELYEDLPEADARIIDGLMYRHWNAWHDFKYSHLHVAAVADGKAGEGKDLMEGIKADCPVPPFGGSEQFSWSPEGNEIAYTLKDVPKWAESTDSNLWIVNVESGEKKNLTPSMPGYDLEPVYSPDGKWLAFQSMERAGFESDRNRIMLYDRSGGTLKELTVGLDQNANGINWSPDSKKILFQSQYRGTDQVFEMGLDSAEKANSTGTWSKCFPMASRPWRQR